MSIEVCYKEVNIEGSSLRLQYRYDTILLVIMYALCMYMYIITACAVAQSCCISDVCCQWEGAIFDPP